MDVESKGVWACRIIGVMSTTKSRKLLTMNNIQKREIKNASRPLFRTQRAIFHPKKGLKTGLFSRLGQKKGQFRPITNSGYLGVSRLNYGLRPCQGPFLRVCLVVSRSENALHVDLTRNFSPYMGKSPERQLGPARLAGAGETKAAYRAI
jgi:hypothetical protein